MPKRLTARDNSHRRLNFRSFPSAKARLTLDLRTYLCALGSESRLRASANLRQFFETHLIERVFNGMDVIEHRCVRVLGIA